MNRHIALGIVIYHAGDELLSRLKLASSDGFDIYIFDNSPDIASVRELAKHYSNIHYLTCGKNLGLATGISTVCANAHQNGHNALLFFDQDTGFTSETLSYVESSYERSIATYETFSAVAFKSGGNAFVHDVPLLINSGSLYVLKNLKALNWLDCTYFVDGVDYKLCLDSLRNGYRIGSCGGTPGFDHVTEQADDRYHIGGRTYSMRAYSWTRIKDTTSSYLRLTFEALKYSQFSFAMRIAKLLAIYCTTQVLVRTINTLGILKRD